MVWADAATALHHHIFSDSYLIAPGFAARKVTSWFSRTSVRSSPVPSVRITAANRGAGRTCAAWLDGGRRAARFHVLVMQQGENVRWWKASAMGPWPMDGTNGQPLRGLWRAVPNLTISARRGSPHLAGFFATVDPSSSHDNTISIWRKTNTSPILSNPCTSRAHPISGNRAGYGCSDSPSSQQRRTPLPAISSNPPPPRAWDS